MALIIALVKVKTGSPVNRTHGPLMLTAILGFDADCVARAGLESDKGEHRVIGARLNLFRRFQGPAIVSHTRIFGIGPIIHLQSCKWKC